MRIQNLSGVVAGQTTWAFSANGQVLSLSTTVMTGNEQGHMITFGTGGTGVYMVDNITIAEIG